MFLKKIPPINIVLFIVMLGIVAAAIIGVAEFVKINDDPYDNYVETTYNASLSKHYTDSLSHTHLAELGEIKISIYDSIENMHKSFVLCSIKNYREAFSYYEVRKRAVTTLRPLFPNETWEGEITYSIIEPTRYRSTTMSVHSKLPEGLDESYSPWDD